MHSIAWALLVVLSALCCSVPSAAQSGGYVVRGDAKVLNGNTIRVSGVDVTLSGVEPVKGFEASAARSLKRRIGNREVGCMVDGNWSGKNWGYCTSRNRVVYFLIASLERLDCCDRPPPGRGDLIQPDRSLVACPNLDQIVGGDPRKPRTRDVKKTLNAVRFYIHHSSRFFSLSRVG